MGDRIVVMRDGLIQQIDEPLSLYNKPVNQFVAGFIGSPSMNFIRGTLSSNGGGLVFDEGNVQLTLPAGYDEQLGDHADQEVMLGIRPEDTRLLLFPANRVAMFRPCHSKVYYVFDSCNR